MKKYEVELAIFNDSGAIEMWDCDSIPDYIEADSEIEAIDLAKAYIDDQGGDSKNEEFRAREVIDASYGDYGDYVYDE